MVFSPTRSSLVRAGGRNAYRLFRLASLRDWFHRWRCDRTPPLTSLDSFFRSLEVSSARLAPNQTMEHAGSEPDYQWHLDSLWNAYRPWLDLDVQGRFDRLGLDKPSRSLPPDVAAFSRTLRRLSLSRQARDTRSRIHHAILEDPRSPWFHLTLTVDPLHYGTVFSTGSRCFRNFVTELKRVVASCYYPHLPRRKLLDQARADGLWLVRFCCVLEKGELYGRRHLHAVMSFQRLPRQWRDPNRGFLNATNDEVKQISSFWPYGFSRPKPLRLGSHDWFSRQGWRWPSDRSTGRPSVGYDPGAIAGYLSKYLTKSGGSSDLAYRFRTRFSRSFGTAFVSRCLALPPVLLQQLLECCHSSFSYGLLSSAFVSATGLPLPSRSYFASSLVTHSLPFLRDLPVLELFRCLESHRSISPFLACLKTLHRMSRSDSCSSVSPQTPLVPGVSPLSLTRPSLTVPTPPVSKPLPQLWSIPMMMSTSLARSINVPMMSRKPSDSCCVSVFQAIASLHKTALSLGTRRVLDGDCSGLLDRLVSFAPVAARLRAPQRPSTTPTVFASSP